MPQFLVPVIQAIATIATGSALAVGVANIIAAGSVVGAPLATKAGAIRRTPRPS